MEIEPLAIKILSSLIFEETFEHILEESGEKNRNIVSDILKTLVMKDLVRVYEKRNDKFVAVAHIEPDTYAGQFFRITAKGMRFLST